MEGFWEFSTCAVTALLSAGAEHEQRSKDGALPLFLAAKYGLAGSVSMLLANGAIVNVTCGRNRFTPLLIAAAFGHAAVIEKMLEPGNEQVADVNACDSEGNTALALAALLQQHEYVRVVELLVAKVRDCNVQNTLGKAVLMIAIEKNESDVVKTLLDHNCNMQLKDNRGFTALHYAAIQSNLGVVKQLLDWGASPLAEANSGKLPVEVVGMPSFRVCEQDKYVQNLLAEAGGAKGPVGVKEAVSGVHEALLNAPSVERFLHSFMSAAQLVKTDGFRSILNGISIVAVLIITVTFLGLQTPPGGTSDSEGGLVKLAIDKYTGRFIDDVNRMSLRTYFILDGVSLFLAASDLLLVLTFLLPGVSTLFRKQEQAAWVWLMLATCMLLLALALLCAVGAYLAVGFAVFPVTEYYLMYVVIGVGGVVLLPAFMLLLGFIMYVRPLNAGQFVFGTLPRILWQNAGLGKKREGIR